MTRLEAIDRIVAHKDELRGMGVASLAVFGSVARNEATDSSDVDILIEFDRPIGYFHFYDVQEALRKALKTPCVDLVMRSAVIEDLREDILGEAVDVF
ncbi:MAG: nucleotidyltransferase family protein [Candidatus Hydrogenedentales bacterium]